MCKDKGDLGLTITEGASTHVKEATHAHGLSICHTQATVLKAPPYVEAHCGLRC
jgi:hypothetical protein